MPDADLSAYSVLGRVQTIADFTVGLPSVDRDTDEHGVTTFHDYLTGRNYPTRLEALLAGIKATMTT